MTAAFYGSRRSQSGWESLTSSERTVVSLVVEGLSNPQIGERLSVSRRTVSTHLYRIFKKVGVSSRAELVARAMRRDLSNNPTARTGEPSRIGQEIRHLTYGNDIPSAEPHRHQPKGEQEPRRKT